MEHHIKSLHINWFQDGRSQSLTESSILICFVDYFNSIGRKCCQAEILRHNSDSAIPAAHHTVCQHQDSSSSTYIWGWFLDVWHQSIHPITVSFMITLLSSCSRTLIVFFSHPYLQTALYNGIHWFSLHQIIPLLLGAPCPWTHGNCSFTLNQPHYNGWSDTDQCKQPGWLQGLPAPNIVCRI